MAAGLVAAALAAAALSGCSLAATGGARATQAADPSRPVEERPTHSPTPTAVADPDRIRASGVGPGVVEIPNPYFPIAEGRDRLTFASSFACDGPGSFHVQLLPESSGVYSGGTECGGAGGGYAMPIERSQQVYVVEITVEPGTSWTFSGQLSR